MNNLTEKLSEALRLQAEIEQAKKLYEELDRLVLELQAAGFERAKHHGLDIELVDNFAETNVAFRMAAVKRFELKVRKAKGEGA